MRHKKPALERTGCKHLLLRLTRIDVEQKLTSVPKIAERLDPMQLQ